MSDADRVILGSVDDARELFRAAQRLAASVDPLDRKALRLALGDDGFLTAMDDAEKYLGPRQRLRIRRIIEALAANPQGHGVLSALTSDAVFLAEDSRCDLLILATAAIDPAPPEVCTFWLDHSLPDDGFTPLTIDAICRNGSTPALSVLETRLLDPAHEPEAKLDWFHVSIFDRRTNKALIVLCQRLAADGLNPDLRVPLVETFFDYLPEQWFSPATLRMPPSEAAMTPDARRARVDFGDWALSNLAVSERLQRAVETTIRSDKELMAGTGEIL